MPSSLRSRAVRLAIALARRLPVSVLRPLNQRLHRGRVSRRLLNAVWTTVGDEPVVVPRGGLQGWRFAAGGGQPGYLLGASEPEMQEALALCIRPGDVIYDVGANVGFFALLSARLTGERGHVYAFEPIEANIRALRRNFEMNGVGYAEVVASAVAERSGAARMSTGANQATGHLSDGADGLVEVRLTSIDEFLRSGRRPPDLVKIDVEGAENLVLAGMRSTLREHRPLILCELHYEPGDPRRGEIGELLAEVDYQELELPLDGGSMPHLLAAPRERAGSLPSGLMATPSAPAPA